MGSGGCRIATPLDIFVEPARGRGALRGDRVALPRPRLARGAQHGAPGVSVEEWGVDGSGASWSSGSGAAARARRTRRAHPAQRRSHRHSASRSRPGLNYVGLLVAGRPRACAAAARGCARRRRSTATATCASRPPRTSSFPNVPDAIGCRGSKRAAAARAAARSARRHPRAGGVHRHRLLPLRADRDQRDRASGPPSILATRLPHDQRVTTHWSGCPAGCGNHAAADIGLLGKNIRVNGEMVDAVDIFIGGRAGPNAKAGHQDARRRAVRGSAGGARDA